VRGTNETGIREEEEIKYFVIPFLRFPGKTDNDK
jgi:hypothetical protein